MKLTDALKTYRQHHALTAKAMAEILGVSAPFMADVEAGKRRLTDERIMRLGQGELRSILLSARADEYQATAQMLRTCA